MTLVSVYADKMTVKVALEAPDVSVAASDAAAAETSGAPDATLTVILPA